METKLTSPQDYVDLYDRMGCVDFMNHYFHMYDYMGVMTRITHSSKQYALSLDWNKQPHYCSTHRKWHSKMVLDDDSQEFRTICPESADPTDYRPHPRYYAGSKASNGYGFIQPNVQGNDIWIDIYQARIFYSSTYLWNPIVLDYKNNGDKFRESNKLDYIVAYIPTMEIDVKGTQSNRKDMLDKDTFTDFETADGYIMDRFADEFDGEFTKRTSGNGMYYQGEPIPIKDKRELDNVMIGFQDFCYEIEEYFTNKETLTLKNITFDIDSVPGWNKYFKAPFSLHRKFDRISLPLPPYEYLDYDYIETYSNPDNLTEDIVNDIVKEAGYT